MSLRLFARFRSLVRGVFRRARVEQDMADEFRHHLELRTEDLVRKGLDPKKARRQARIEFGHIENHKDDARHSRGLRFFDELRFSSLDIKLGLRMLMKYPGLSVISVVGMSVAIAIGAAAFGLISGFLNPSLPLDEDDRIVSIQNVDIRNRTPQRQSIHDFELWRDGLQSLTDLGAFTADRRNLFIPGGGVQLVSVAKMTASGFELARVGPLLGRPILEEDQHAAAPPVVVIAHDVWQRQFGADPDVVGRGVRLGASVHTVVGVMPEGFHFPVNHRYWIPLKARAADFQRGGGPALNIFGRLASGFSIKQARAEIEVFGLRMASAHPETNEFVRPEVMRFTRPYFDIDSPEAALAFRMFQLAIGLLLVLVAANVAILVYARTATRAGEIAVRTALGASRRRVVVQLMVEALVLAGISAAVGLAIASAALEQVVEFQRRASFERIPYWLDMGVSPSMVVYTVGLALVASMIVGVLPALKATGREVHAGLQRLAARGSGMQLGKTWTTLVVVQVTLAVAALPLALQITQRAVERGTLKVGYADDQLLRATLSMERNENTVSSGAEVYERTFENSFRGHAVALVRRLETEPEIEGVTFAGSFPGWGPLRRLEFEGVGPARASTSEPGSWQSRASAMVHNIDTDLFDVFGVPMLAGRSFTGADLPGASAVIVDRTFVDRFPEVGDGVGRRFRFIDRVRIDGVTEIVSGPWLDIVGVVPTFTVPNDFDPVYPMVFRPLDLAVAPTVLSLMVRTRGVPATSVAEKLLDITVSVDPALQVHGVRSAEAYNQDEQRALLALALVIVAVTGSVLLLSAAGMYAMMSFTVARRTREIGIRSALGADPRRLLASIFARAGKQLGLGLAAGLVVAGAIDLAFGGQLLGGNAFFILPVVGLLMILVGLIAVVGPARRGLAVEPTEALREE